MAKAAMIDMELSDEGKIDAPCTASAPKGPDYPWGLRISLETEQLKKLGLDVKDLPLGAMIHLHGMACVTSCSESESEYTDGKQCRVELQIKALAVESEDLENDEEEAAEAEGEKKPAARRAILYGGRGKVYG